MARWQGGKVGEPKHLVARWQGSQMSGPRLHQQGLSASLVVNDVFLSVWVICVVGGVRGCGCCKLGETHWYGLGFNSTDSLLTKRVVVNTPRWMSAWWLRRDVDMG